RAGPRRNRPQAPAHRQRNPIAFPFRARRISRNRTPQTATLRRNRFDVTIASAAVLFFLVLDPLGNIPFFFAGLKAVPPERRSRVIIRELLIAYAVMVVFLFAGQSFLGLLHISEPALTIAGGVILFLIALRMVFPSPEKSMQE